MTTAVHRRDRMVGSAYVTRRLGIHRNNIPRLVERGELPRPIRIGRQYRWERSQIEQWIRDRFEETKNEGPRCA